MDIYYTYIIQSEKSGRFYIGHTNDIVARLERHNEGCVTATRNKGPWKIYYKEIFNTKLEANQRELAIKKKKSRSYILSLINN